MRELHELESPPLQMQKMQSMRVEKQFVSGPHSASLYHLPIGETAEDILVNLNEKAASPQESRKAKRLKANCFSLWQQDQGSTTGVNAEYILVNLKKKA